MIFVLLCGRSFRRVVALPFCDLFKGVCKLLQVNHALAPLGRRSIAQPVICLRSLLRAHSHAVYKEERPAKPRAVLVSKPTLVLALPVVLDVIAQVLVSVNVFKH